MAAIASVLVVILISLLITRVATVALTLTGLSTETARFQARSALSGTGFTTSEAEGVVGHPVRRRIVMMLMLIGGAGLVTVIATLMLSFSGAEGNALDRIGLLLGGLTALWLLAKSNAVNRRLSWLIAKVLDRWTDLDARDYGALLHLSDRYAVGEIAVREGDWLAERTLDELELREEGVVILALTLADGAWVGSPTFDAHIRPGDRVLAYGPAAQLRELDRRPAGEEGHRVHEEAVRAHRSEEEQVAEEHRPDSQL